MSNTLYVNGYDIDRDKITGIWIGGEGDEEYNKDAALVYMDGGHIFTLSKADGLLVRDAWRKSHSGSLDLRARARHIYEREGGGIVESPGDYPFTKDEL